MARKAWRVAYIEGVDNVLGSTTFYGASRQDAEQYAAALFKDMEGGVIQVDETGDVGVPGDGRGAVGPVHERRDGDGGYRGGQ